MMSDTIRDATAAIYENTKQFRFAFIADLDTELGHMGNNVDQVKYLSMKLAGYTLTSSGGHSVALMLEQMQRDIVANRLTQYMNRI